MLYPDFNDLVACGDLKQGLMHPTCLSAQSTVSGNHRSTFRGRGLEFDSVREYVVGDDIRSIDWRVTARTGSPHLKIFQEERERHIVICVDMNATMRFGTKKTFKSVQAARVAALLGWSGIAQQDRVSACLFGDVPHGIQFFAPKRTRRSFCSLLKTLAAPPSEKHRISLKDAFQRVSQTVHAGSLVYFISDFMDINKDFVYESSLFNLSQKCDVVFIGINDAADKAMYPLGRVGFCGRGDEKVYVNTESVSGRNAYALLWEEREKKLQEITSKLKIPLLELTTESNVQQDLIFGLKSMAKRKKR